MSKVLISVFILLLVFDGAVLADGGSNAPIPAHLDVEATKKHSLNQDLNLSDEEIRSLISQALAGSSKAAIRLGNYYAFVRSDWKAQLYWYRIAAEDGDPDGWYSYGVVLWESADTQDKQRAHFWIDKAAAAGVKQAKDFFKDKGN